MKQTLYFLFMGLLVLCFAACNSRDSSAIMMESRLSYIENSESSSTINDITTTEDVTFHEESGEKMSMEQTTFYITVGEATFSATFADNSGAQALKELLADGDITIEMSDYAGFEKVGSLGQSLPTSNSQINTQTGDIVLYQGNQIVIFYGSNSWSYTQLGKIDNLAGLEEALGGGDVSVTFSLTAKTQ